MSVRTASQKIAFRHGTFDTHPRLGVGFSLALLLAVSFVAVRSGLDWLFLILVCGLVLWLCASLAYEKVEIWDNGFRYRSFSGNHVFEFAHIEDALFETAKVGEGYPAPVFSVRLRDTADRKQIPIGMYPIRAAATLFTALERHGIQIREDGSQLVQSTMRQIREAQLTQSTRECCLAGDGFIV